MTDRIRHVLNEEAEDLRDTLSCVEVFVLHSEVALQVWEALRVGGGVSPDDSILLRDYLRLFASVVAWQSTGQKVQDLLSQAKEKIWVDPDAAVKEVEELAESLARPEIYRELLRFYEVRNASGATILKRAQRYGTSPERQSDSLLWRAVAKAFDPQARWRLGSQDWAPNLDFVKAVWRDAGKKDAEFAIKIADAYNQEDRESLAANVLLEVIKNTDPTVEALSRCIVFLDRAKRGDEADALIQQFKAKLGNDRDLPGVGRGMPSGAKGTRRCRSSFNLPLSHS